MIRNEKVNLVGKNEDNVEGRFKVRVWAHLWLQPMSPVRDFILELFIIVQLKN